MSLSHEITIPVTLTGAVEKNIYAPNSAEIDVESAVLIPGISEGKEAVNFTTISLIDKGAGGVSSDEIASIKTEDVAEGVALTANVKQAITPSASHTSGNAIAIKKVDAGTAVTLGDCVLILKVREK
jgi:hypothetical protein